MNRFLLTLCGVQSLPKEDAQFAYAYSIRKGYATLNKRLHEVGGKNPDVVIHSVSHTCVVLPKDAGIMVSATMVYSGLIRNMDALLEGKGNETLKQDLEEGLGTTYFVTL